ncbi:GDSL esterase/lipase [Heracleum sosnowskyi]|uniref:GDSL esterase/lipase n=1 Tax=Heracleum sosnowskyi TaxID=360622 RepID=A0AAD8H5F8_9APIA|nr:GDSL esterase/lipase [Heracleum sosnowskyi]
MATDNCNIVASVIFLIIIYLGLFGKGSDELENGALFIFGDSLVDAGNNNYLSTLSKANVIPNGIDFKASGGFPTGRFTNGRTIGDIVGEKLGQPYYPLPFLAPYSPSRNILHGVNYASGGGGILKATGTIFIERLSMDTQIDYFNITRKSIDELLGTTKARQFIMKNSIFPIVVGSNDFLNNYLLPILSVGQRISTSPDAFIADVIKNFNQQLNRLYQLDARKFVIGNVAPLGCIPYQKKINGLNETQCVTLPNRMASRYNAKLKTLVLALNKTLPGATFVLANVYDLIMDVVTNHKNYGFETAGRACCGNGHLGGIMPCKPGSSMCLDRDKYVFWDPYHPSEAANLIIADRLLDGDTKYIFPMSIRELRDL